MLRVGAKFQPLEARSEHSLSDHKTNERPRLEVMHTCGDIPGHAKKGEKTR